MVGARKAWEGSEMVGSDWRVVSRSGEGAGMLKTAVRRNNDTRNALNLQRGHLMN